jgi:Glycosyl transferases group 1
MRFFEVLAAGAMLVTQASYRNGQHQLAGLREGEHFVTFDSAEDLVRKIDYYLANPGERQRIAAAGRAVAISQHSYDCRVRQVLEHIAQDHRRMRAPLRRWPPEQQAWAYMETHALMRMIDATMMVSFSGLTGFRKWRARAGQLYYAATAFLRRIKHEWK